MSRTNKGYRLCPCGRGGWGEGQAPTVALVMQLATLGEFPRRRAAAVTVYPCSECLSAIHQKQGRKLRRTLAAALVTQWAELARKGANPHGNRKSNRAA